MSFFKKIITREEFKRLRSKLHSEGLTWRDVDEVEAMFESSLNEGGWQKGIDSKEVDQTISWMRDNTGKHRISLSQIDKIEQVFKSEL